MGDGPRARGITGAGGAIRPLERHDVPQLAAALANGAASPGLLSFLEETLFDQPWADPELRSLVYEEKGEILGTIAASPRRMRFDGRPLRAAVSAYLWAHPRVRERGVGARLLRAFLSGPQDLTVTDGATPAVRRMWEAFGGQTVHLGSLSYVRLFRPAQVAVRLLEGRVPRLARAAAPAAGVLDAIATRVARSPLRPPRSPAASEPLTPAAMVEHLPAVGASLRLRPEYDRPYLEWLFAQLEVVRHLHARACALGAAAVLGRLEPPLVAALETEPGPVAYLRRGGHMLVHARSPELVAAVLAGDALLTRLDGEWWVS